MAPNVLGTLWYLKGLDLWKTTKPYFINVPQVALPESQPTSNEVSEPVHDVPIRDMRDADSPKDIDLCGFDYKTHDFQVSTEIFKDPIAVRQQYVPEVEGWVRQVTGAEIVYALTSEVRALISSRTQPVIEKHRFAEETLNSPRKFGAFQGRSSQFKGYTVVSSLEGL
jgi:hypothetical protein